MDDFKGFIWIIAAIGFFIWRMVQKASEKFKEAQLEEQRRQARTSGGGAAPRLAPSVPAVSFEELLAQMQRQNQQAAQPPLAERNPPQEWEQRQQQWDEEQRWGQEPQPEALPDRPRPVARFGRALEKPEELYSQELPAPEARSLEAPRRALRRGSALPRTSTEHGSEDFWSQEKVSPKQTRRTVNELLRNPADIRAAFVLSEIFQRRY